MCTKLREWLDKYGLFLKIVLTYNVAMALIAVPVWTVWPIAAYIMCGITLLITFGIAQIVQFSWDINMMPDGIDEILEVMNEQRRTARAERRAAGSAGEPQEGQADEGREGRDDERDV